MRLYVIPVCFGLLGAIVFWLAISFEQFPDELAFLTYPGIMLSFGLVQGSPFHVALIAGAAVQFIMFMLAGMLVAAASYVVS